MPLIWVAEQEIDNDYLLLVRGLPVTAGRISPVGVEVCLPRMSDDQIVADLRARLDHAATEDRCSGAVLVAKKGKILFEHAYGFADHAFNALNKLDTKFNLGSMAKMFHRRVDFAVGSRRKALFKRHSYQRSAGLPGQGHRQENYHPSTSDPHVRPAGYVQREIYARSQG